MAEGFELSNAEMFEWPKVFMVFETASSPGAPMNADSDPKLAENF
jgi:hypothetical protein